MTRVMARRYGCRDRDCAAHRRSRPSPAPPAYRPPSYYEDSGRRRSPWPMILGLVAVVIAAVGGYLVYQKVNAAIDKNAPVAVQNVEQTPVKNAELILHQQGLQTHVVEEASYDGRRGARDQPEPGAGRSRRQGRRSSR